MAATDPVVDFDLKLSAAQLGEIWGAGSDTEAAALVARIAQIEEPDEEPRLAIWVDFLYQQLVFAKEEHLIAPKALTFFHVMLKTHKHAIESMCTHKECFQFFADALLAATKELPVRSRFSLPEVNAISAHVRATYVASIKLHQLAFTQRQTTHPSGCPDGATSRASLPAHYGPWALEPAGVGRWEVSAPGRSCGRAESQMDSRRRRDSAIDLFVQTPFPPAPLADASDEPPPAPAPAAEPAAAPEAAPPADEAAAPAATPAAAPAAPPAAAPAAEPEAVSLPGNEELANAINKSVSSQVEALQARMAAEYAQQEQVLLERIENLAKK